MLFLHLPTRHPSSYPELEISSLVQAAALLGVGLLFQGSCHRWVGRECVCGWRKGRGEVVKQGACGTAAVDASCAGHCTLGVGLGVALVRCHDV